MTAPLQGFRILDLTAVLMGPFCTHFLAEQGADVIKIEAPEGDITRHLGRAPEPAMSPVFQHVNRNKRSVVLDLKAKDDLAVLHGLLKDADAVVFNIRPEAMARLGLGYEAVRAINPRIVYCAFTGFGSGGAYAGRPAYDDLIQGLSGVADLNLRAGAGARYAPMALADRVVGLYGLSALVMALLARERSGEGCALEIPMFESMAHFVMVEHMFLKSFVPALGESGATRTLDRNRRPFKTADGYLCMLGYSDRHWARIFHVIERTELMQDPRFASPGLRLENIEPLNAALAEGLLAKTTAQWLEIFEREDVPAAPMNSIEDMFDDPHLRDVGFFREVDEFDRHKFIHMRHPIRWSNWESDLPDRTARLGEHTGEASWRP
ncbi:CaiB/BaiF CoA transferase family protein [Ramlibacter sp.]|uniref:CaiB/BaiF CoA transferase family protein n=1 Tax=Ramlibacter sp. TaxID=1917967 RepID=UPI003D0A1A7B